jgi:hypothetical protein
MSRRMRWTGHEEKVYTVWESQKERDHCEDQGVIVLDLREIGWGNVEWTQLAQDRDRL